MLPVLQGGSGASKKARPLRYRAAIARKDLQHPTSADVGEGLPLRSCTLSDVSQTGAKLAIENPNDMPAEFTLLLTGGPSVARCRVMRRGNGEIGVQFLNASPPQSVASTR